MKHVLYLILAMMLTTSCATTIGIGDDDIYVSTHSSIYYDDSRWTGYEIVWINDWPYWYGNSLIIPYHHNHTLILNNHYHIVRHPYKPILHNNRFHPKYQGKEYHKNRTHYGRPNQRYDEHNHRPSKSINHNSQQHKHQGIHDKRYDHSKPNTQMRSMQSLHLSNHNRTTRGSSGNSRQTQPSLHLHSGSRAGRR